MEQESYKLGGFCCVETEGSLAKLLRLTVDKTHRRQGLGSRLMKFVLAEVGNFRKISTVIAESNLEAQCFLRKHDWKCVNVLPKHLEIKGQLEDAYYFVKKLQ